MKLRKIMTGIVASSLAVSTLAIVTSADGILKQVKEEDGKSAGLSSGSGSWLIQVYNEGNPDEGKPATKYDIDY